MNHLHKRRVWRPMAAGTPVRGGAGGFHYPQKPGRTNYVSPGSKIDPKTGLPRARKRKRAAS